MQARRWPIVLLAVLVAGPLVARPADASPRTGPPLPPYTNDSFAFAEPRVRDVRLTEAAGSGTSGTITVRLNNRTRLAGRLQLRYFPYTGGPARVLLGPGRRRDGASARVLTGTVRRLGLRDYALIRLRFTLPRVRALADLDGLVVAQLLTRGRHGPVARMRVRGAAPRVTFDPAKIAFAVERYPLLGSSGTTKEVIVRGPDAAALARGDRPIGTQVLGSGGSQIRVDVAPPVRSDDGVYRAAVTLSDIAGLDTGDFAGAVPLTQGRGGARLEVEAKVGFSFLVMTFVIFCGALVAGFGRRYTTASRDARTLRMKLRTAVADYDARTEDEGVCSHRLDAWLTPRPKGRGLGRYPGTRGLAGMLWHLRTARTKRDVDEQRFRVRETIRHIERFLVLEPVARTAAGLLEERAPTGRVEDTDPIRAGWLHRDLARLLDDAHVAPDPTRPPVTGEAAWTAREEEDNAKARALVAALAGRALTLDLALDAWTFTTAYADLKLAPPVQDHVAAIQRETLATLTQTERPSGTEQRLRLALEARLRALQETWPPDLPRPTREAPGYGTRQLAGLSADPSAPVAPGTDTTPRVGRDWGRIVQVDWAWTLVTGMVSAVAYTITAEAITDGTWGGGVIAYASAFVVGTAGEAVPWAQLPGYFGLDSRPEEPVTQTAPASARTQAPETGADTPDREPEPAGAAGQTG